MATSISSVPVIKTLLLLFIMIQTGLCIRPHDIDRANSIIAANFGRVTLFASDDHIRWPQHPGCPIILHKSAQAFYRDLRMVFGKDVEAMATVRSEFHKWINEMNIRSIDDSVWPVCSEIHDNHEFNSAWILVDLTPKDSGNTEKMFIKDMVSQHRPTGQIFCLVNNEILVPRLPLITNQREKIEQGVWIELLDDGNYRRLLHHEKETPESTSSLLQAVNELGEFNLLETLEKHQGQSMHDSEDHIESPSENTSPKIPNSVNHMVLGPEPNVVNEGVENQDGTHDAKLQLRLGSTIGVEKMNEMSAQEKEFNKKRSEMYERRKKIDEILEASSLSMHSKKSMLKEMLRHLEIKHVMEMNKLNEYLNLQFSNERAKMEEVLRKRMLETDQRHKMALENAHSKLESQEAACDMEVTIIEGHVEMCKEIGRDRLQSERAYCNERVIDTEEKCREDVQNKLESQEAVHSKIVADTEEKCQKDVQTKLESQKAACDKEVIDTEEKCREYVQTKLESQKAVCDEEVTDTKEKCREDVQTKLEFQKAVCDKEVTDTEEKCREDVQTKLESQKTVCDKEVTDTENKCREDVQTKLESQKAACDKEVTDTEEECREYVQAKLESQDAVHSKIVADTEDKCQKDVQTKLESQKAACDKEVTNIEEDVEIWKEICRNILEYESEYCDAVITYVDERCREDVRTKMQYQERILSKKFADTDNKCQEEVLTKLESQKASYDKRVADTEALCDERVLDTKYEWRENARSKLKFERAACDKRVSDTEEKCQEEGSSALLKQKEMYISMLIKKERQEKGRLH